MDLNQAQRFIDEQWDSSIVPSLIEYIKIPNKSPHFDPHWNKHGYMDDAVELIAAWASAQEVDGMQLQVVQLEGRTPIIFMEIPGHSDDTVLLYGHLDKQPEMAGWAEGLGPWIPVLKDDKLYGRGGADDGYATYASLTAIAALHQQNIPHARCVVLIEACEESGSYDLPYYIDHLSDRIGIPSLVVCLDSGAGNYEQLWMTVSLRGLASGTLRAEVLNEGVHSGYASGIVPSSFRVLRELIDRLEDPKSGRILPPNLRVEVPSQRLQQVQQMAAQLGDNIHTAYPFKAGVKPMGDNPCERILNRTWRPALSVTGVDGIPSLDNAGNVLRPYTALKLSLRLPPMIDGEKASLYLKELLEKDPPYNAKVTFEPEQSATGWNAPEVAPWLQQSLQNASSATFGTEALYMGEGGTIPFMAMLGDAYPEAQFMIAGVLGPQSNAHGPNEFLHIPYAKKLTTCVARVLQDHYNRD